MAIPVQPIPRRLFEPLRLGRLMLPNRIVMAPMTRCRAEDINVPGALAPQYYAQRAGAGLIVTEATQVSEGAQGYWRTPGLHSERQCAVWRQVTERVHAAGGRIFVQLWHNGRVFHPDNVAPGVRPVAPSAIAADIRVMTPNGLHSAPVPNELDAQGIAQVTREFVDAARLAIDCGFDGVEVHAANGYLFDQFLHRSSNRRTDAWGGSIENRARLLIDTVAAVCRQIGADRVGVRVSPLGTFNDVHDPQPEQIYRHVARRLSELQLAYLHVIRPSVSGSSSVSVPTADPLPEIRSLYSGTLLVAGDLDVVSADRLVDEGLADGTAFGRWFIGNPDLPQRLRNGWPLVDAARAGYYSGGAKGYVDFPRYQCAKPVSAGQAKPPLIKVVYCIRRRADLTEAAFQRYWKEVHAPLVLQRAADLRLAAYVQTSPTHHAFSQRVERKGVLAQPYDGVAELYWASEDDMRHAFESAEALQVQRLLADDECNFIDHARSARWIATETAPIEQRAAHTTGDARCSSN